MKIFTTFHKRNVLITAKLRYCFSSIRLTKIPQPHQRLVEGNVDEVEGKQALS